MKKQLLILMTLFTVVIGYSQTVGDTFTEDFITYEITSLTPNTIEAIDYDIAGGTMVNVPATILYSSITFDVTSIRQAAFFNKQLSNISIGSNVTYVGFGAFQNNQLMSVTIPDNVTTLSNQAFSNNNLTSTSIGSGITSIPDLAFSGIDLVNVTIPANINNIGWRVFQGNPLTCVISEAPTPATITTGGSNDSFGNGNGNRSNIDLTIPSGTANAYATGTWTGFNSVTEGLTGNFVVDNITYQITSATNNTVKATSYNTVGGTVVNIPATVSRACTVFTVTEIGPNAFYDRNLTSLTIPNTVITLSSSCFALNNLTSVIIPDSVETIEQGAFNHNINMNSLVLGNNLTIPNTVTSIAENAFLQNNLTNVVIPDGVTSIGVRAFAGNDLTDIVIPNNVISIGDYAFSTNVLANVSIGNNVTSIGLGAFGANPLVSVISLASTPPAITTGGNDDSFSTNRSTINLVIPSGTTGTYATDSGAFWTDFKLVCEITSTSPDEVKITDYNSASGTSVTIPSTITGGSVVYDVTEIGDSAFSNKGLTSVIIPDSVTNIGDQAFVTNSLTNVAIGNSVTTIGLGAFVDNDLTSITIPANVTNIGLVAFQANPLTDVFTESLTPPTITTGTNDTFATDRSTIHLHIPAGTMGVYVTDAGALWTGFNPVTEDALSVSDFEFANDIKVITTSGVIKIVSSNNISLQSYAIYNISGAKVATGRESEITTSFFASGIYILKLDFDKGTVVKKVLVN